LDKQWDDILNEFETFTLARNSRPHWGKEFTIDKHQVETMYPHYKAFAAMKNTFDPTSKFSNQLLNKLF